MNPEQFQNIINSATTFGLLLAIFALLYYFAIKRQKQTHKNK